MWLYLRQKCFSHRDFLLHLFIYSHYYFLRAWMISESWHPSDFSLEPAPDGWWFCIVLFVHCFRGGGGGAGGHIYVSYGRRCCDSLRHLVSLSPCLLLPRVFPCIFLESTHACFPCRPRLLFVKYDLTSRSQSRSQSVLFILMSSSHTGSLQLICERARY